MIKVYGYFDKSAPEKNLYYQITIQFNCLLYIFPIYNPLKLLLPKQGIFAINIYKSLFHNNMDSFSPEIAT